MDLNQGDGCCEGGIEGYDDSNNIGNEDCCGEKDGVDGVADDRNEDCCGEKNGAGSIADCAGGILNKNEGSGADENTDADGGINEDAGAKTKSKSCGESRRIRKPPTWMKDYTSRKGSGSSDDDETNLALLMSNDLVHYEEAVTDANWRMEMDNEIKSIENNKTWTLVTLRVGCKIIGVRWIYKTNYNEHGVLEKYKTQLVAKRYTHKHGINYMHQWLELKLSG